MKSKSADKIKMPSIDELLGVSGEESATDIEISRIHSFANHPYEDHLGIDGFRNRQPEGVHSLHPLHLIVGFQRFGNALTLCPLLHKTVKQLLRLFLNIGKVGMQPAACQKAGIKRLFMLTDIPQMPLPPYADVPFFFFGW